MATNRIFEKGTQLVVAPTDAPNDPAESGDPVLLGDLPGVALTDADDDIASDGEATVQFDGVFDLEVVGEDNAGNAAITAGDIVFYDGGEINVDDTDGTRFGYALEDVASGATTTIRVKVGY